MNRVVELESGRVDLDDRVLRRADGTEQRLTPTEAALLGHLAASPEVPVARSELLREVWGYREGVRTRTIDTTMRRLRRKVERVPSVPRHLETVEGVGYRFTPLTALSLAGTASAVLDATIGREDQLALLTRLADDGAQLLSLTGPGGIGKTRLAMAWVRDRPALVVELQDLSRADGLLEAICAAGELPPAGLVALAGQLVQRRVEWLVLDNVEQLLPAAAPTIRALAATELRVLTTSRLGLGVDGETRVEVPPLSLEAGAALLRARAPSALARSDEHSLQAIVAQVDGMPLAVELAAAHAPLLGTAGLQRRLARSLDLLHEVAGPGRPRSMQDVMEWSWGMLASDDRHTLGELLVFKGGFTVDAAEAVLSDGRPLQRLHRLRDQSWLVARQGPGGNRMDLLQPIRGFLQAHLQPDAEAAARHARWFARFGEDEARYDLDRDDGTARRALAADWHNLLAAADHCLSDSDGVGAARVLLAAWEAARLRHPPGALRARIERALSLDAATLPAPLRARLGVALADVLRSHASPQPGVDAASVALAQADSPALQARALAMRAVVHQEHGALDSALEDHHKALERARSVDAQRILGIIHSNLGNLLMRRGQLHAARDHLSTAVSCFDALALRRLAAIARFNLGTVWHDLGELETAEDWYHEALREHRALGNLRYVALAEGNLGSLALDRGRPADLDEAAERLQLAEPMHVRVGNLRSAGIVRLTAAELARLRGRSDEATAQLVHARRFGQSTGSRLLARAVDALQAELEAPARPEAASQRVARAIDRLDEMGASIEAAIARCRQGRIAVASGDTALARACLETAEATRRQQSVQQRSELGRHIRELEALLEAVEP